MSVHSQVKMCSGAGLRRWLSGSECSLCKHEVLSSDPSAHMENQVCTPVTSVLGWGWGIETRRGLGFAGFRATPAPGSVRDSVLKRRR